MSHARALLTFLVAIGMTLDLSAEERVSPEAAAAMTRLIDEQVDSKLQSAGVPKSPAADDAEFLRRIHLDLHGVVPKADDVRAFLNDHAAAKRTRVIDQLLADRRFAVHLADLWDDYLIPATDELHSEKQRFTAWLEEAFQTKSWDRLAQELLTATGGRDQNAAVVYLLKGRETLTPPELTDLVTQYFLGMRLNCAQCHDHPFTSWKQSDYWGLPAFFTEFQYTDRRQMKSGMIRDNPAIVLDNMENAARLRTRKFLGGEESPSQSGVPHRQAFANWLTSPQNPYFARAMANRIWAQLFGRGIVEPMDDMHPDNHATHPELLTSLSESFVASGFDVRQLYRAICNSAAYQRTSIPSSDNGPDAKLYSHMAIKVLSPEQLYDSLSMVMPMTGPTKGMNRSANPRDEFVRFFRSEGDTNPTAYNRGIPQTLRMMNSPQLFSPRNESATVQRILGEVTSAPQAIERLYLHVLGRKPTDEECGLLKNFIEQHPGEHEEAYAEILWSLLNSSEFSLNH